MKRCLTTLLAVALLSEAMTAHARTGGGARVAARDDRDVETREPMRTSGHTLQAYGGFSLFGPVTYDRLANFSKTGSAKRDPQLRSSAYGLMSDQSRSYGGYYFKAFGRWLQDAENEETGKYSNDDVGLERLTTIHSHGYGLGVGWSLRSRRRFIKWLPYLGVAFERNIVEVSGRYYDEQADLDESISFRSTLSGVYAEAGFAYRFLHGVLEPDFFVMTAIPLGAKVTHDADSETEREITERLYHGMRFGLTTGLSLAVWLD